MLDRLGMWMTVAKYVGAAVVAGGAAWLCLMVARLFIGCSLLRFSPTLGQALPVPPETNGMASGVDWRNVSYLSVTSILAAAAAFREVRKRWRK